jgi:hypothetical protein
MPLCKTYVIVVAIEYEAIWTNIVIPINEFLIKLCS